jgi:hypothetical protein
MKLKMILLALATMALTASVALAKPPATTLHVDPAHATKPPATGPGCKPQVSIVLKGTVAVAPGATPVLPFSLTVNVKHANKQGKAYVKATQPVTVIVTSDTKVNRQDNHSLAAFLAGDRVTVQARACKADLAHGATPALTATRVDAHAAKPA